MVDGICGWRFWQDGSVVAREFYADDLYCCEIGPGISTTTGLIVKLDEDADGTFETTLTITTDFVLWPLNAADDVPVRPYTEIRLVDNYAFPLHATGRPGVQVTAKFGWAAVPDWAEKACLIQAGQLFKAKDAAFGYAGANEFGSLRAKTNSIALSLLSPYQKPRYG